MEIGRSQASSLVLLFISILQISAGNQIFPSKYVLLKDSTNNVDGGIAFQMDEIRANIQEKLEQNPASHVVSGCIGETFSDNVKDKNLGNSINSDIIGTKLIQEFPYSPYKRTAEIFILLVDSKTKLNGEVPDILLLKKTIIILFGAMELGLWTKMASMSDLVFHITGPEDIPKVEKQLAEQLAIMSEFICDKNKYCMDRRHGSDLYTNCQCQSCGNICNFKLINVSDSCMAYCPHDPHLKAPQKSDKPVTTSVTGNDTWETILIIVIPVISVLAVVAAVIYCIIKKMQKKKKQPIRYVKAHQPQGPYVDTKTGELDAWPAHASGHSVPTSSLMMTKDKSLVLVNDEQMGRPSMIPKPRFLDQLENYLKKELRALDVVEVEPSELRLQAHREVFEYLIEDFKTYKPLLSSIKNEYEMMFAYQRQQIRELEPLKQMLVTVSEQCDQKVMSIRDEEKQEMIDLKQENKRLFKRIEDLKNDGKDLQTQVAKLQDDLANQYKLYRDERDARKLLQSDINDLRYQQEDYQMSQKKEDEEEDDPVMLKIALKHAREDEKGATLRLNEMIANYGDVIPRRDFENLEKKHLEMEEEVGVIRGDFDKLKLEHDALLDVHKQVVKQRDEFYTECETLRRSSTPRPDWDKAADNVRGGMTRWKELTEGKTSNEMVDVLLTEMASGEVVDTGGAEYFDGQGTGPEVPKYLQHDGPVRNRRLGKRDASLLIKDIWREKGANDAAKPDGVRDKMADFLYTYLQRRFGLEQMIIEWGYNLHDACQRYAHDEHVGMFSGVLTEEVEEEIYHNQLQLIQRLMNHLTTIDMDKGNQSKLNKADFRQGLADYLVGVDADTLNAMMKAAESEMDDKDAEDIEYKNLFMEDDEGRTGPFLDEVRKWDNQERMKYVDEIKTQLAETNPVAVDDLKRAILQADIEIDNVKMDKYIQWVFRSDKPYETDPLEQSKVVERLQKGNVARSGRKM